MKIKFLSVVIITILTASFVYPISGKDSFVTFIEYTEEGKIKELAEIQFRYDVDINSYIDVTFHPSAFVRMESGIPLSPESVRLRKELESLNNLLKIAREDLDDYVRDIDTLRKRLLENDDPLIEARFRQKLKERSNFIQKLLVALEPVVGEARLEKALGVSDSLYSGVVSLLAEHINDVQKKLEAETSSLIEHSEHTLRVWCIHSSHGKKPNAIHLNNYDNLEAGSLQIVDKVTLALTEEEDRHLRESVRFHEDLRKLVVDIGDKDSELRQAFSDLTDQFFKDLRDFRDFFGTQTLQELLDEIEKEIGSLDSSEEVNALKGALSDLKEKLKEIFNLIQKNNSLVRNLFVERPDPLTLVTLLSPELITEVEKLKDVLSQKANLDRINEISERIKNFRIVFKKVSTLLSKGLSDKINEFIEVKFQTWIATFSNLDIVLSKYEIFSDYKKVFKGLLERGLFVATISDEVGDIGDLMPKDTLEVAMSKASPTVIDIPRTNRQESDIYNLYVRIYHKGSITLSKEYSFRIKKYGTYSRWTGNLIFAKGEWQNSFQPATSVSWILHHRSRPKEKNGKTEGEGKTKGGGGVLGNVINLGIGLNSVVFSTEGEIEYGLGIAITFFNDILQVGYGFNFQREGSRGYFFIGASLFDLLNPTRSNSD